MLQYWREVVSIAVYTLNHVQVKKGTHSTPFELCYGYPPNVKYFRIFGSKCYIIKDDRNGKFDAKSDEGIFLGYSTRSKAYKCSDTNTNKVVESENVNFDEFTEVHEAPKCNLVFDCSLVPKCNTTFIVYDLVSIETCYWFST